MTRRGREDTITLMRSWGLLSAALLLGCAHSGTQIKSEDGVDLSHYHRIGVPAFTDSRGQGGLIADAVAEGLPKLLHVAADKKALAPILAKYKLDPQIGLGVEALEEIRIKTSADAILYGRMLPDWSAAMITIMETEMGDPIVNALIKPKEPQKSFATPQEVSQEVLRALADIH